MGEQPRGAAASFPVLVVMGVAGSGKSTIGRLLAERLGRRFVDADDFHSAASIDKMRRGSPLTDADRRPWLDALRREVVAPSLARGGGVVLACSALKRTYRERLGAGDPRLRLVYLRGAPELLRARLAGRGGHFMAAAMLESQLLDLEEPQDALAVDIGATPESVVDEIVRRLD